MKLLQNVSNFLILGPSGTGKTTFLSAYAEMHHKEYDSDGYWLTFPSIEPQLSKLLPSWLHTTTDLLDVGFTGPDADPPRKFVIGDEINRLISKYDHAKSEGRSFVDLVAIHRHKNFDLLVSDQVFDFLKGVRNRAHWLIFSGMNDTIYYALRDNLSPKLMWWIDQNQQALVELGDRNRVTIPKGNGAVFISNGVHSFLLKFKRPKWFTPELSTIWRMVSPKDLRRENETEPLIFDFDSDSYDALSLSYHLCKILFTGKITKEKLSAAYIPASRIVFGSAKKLADNGRGAPELLIAAHSLSCKWCEDPEQYKEALQQLKILHKSKSSGSIKEITDLEEEVTVILNG